MDYNIEQVKIAASNYDKCHKSTTLTVWDVSSESRKGLDGILVAINRRIDDFKVGEMSKKSKEELVEQYLSYQTI